MARRYGRFFGFGALGVVALVMSCGGDDSSPSDEGACPAGQLDCGAGCVYVTVDAAHCGACGNACGEQQTCVDGACACPLGSTTCGTTCVDATTDVENCGGCSVACAAGEFCDAGACACLLGRTPCPTGCVDLTSSAANCGACGTTCLASEVCSLGNCAAGCDPGLTQCGQGCFDLDTSDEHCGGCDAPCPIGRACVDGACSCPEGQVECGGECVNVGTNLAHCGSCDHPCASGQSCNDGACECPSDLVLCDGECVNTQTNALHCNGCNQPCSGGSCEGGVCSTPGTGGAGTGGVGTGGATGGAGTGGATGGTGTGGATGGAGTGGTGTGGIIEPPDEPLSDFIVVDQFGYLPVSEKIAVLRDPQTGWDAGQSYAPASTYSLINSATGAAVYTGSAVAWNGGATDASSGDRAWWFDFSSVTAPGTYYVLDTQRNVRSAQFRIADDVYREVLKQAVRTFFYQRAGFAKAAQYAGAAWADGASHVGPLQDANCRRWDAPNNASTEMDLRGGWYDAGDYNKYTSWHASYLIEMFRAIELNPGAFRDDYGIPESGNGTPDLVDEAKFGMDYLVRLQHANGSMVSIVGLASGSPPSSATDPSAYGSPNTSSALSAAAAFAYGSKIFAAQGMTSYASDLRTRAINAWNWADANPNVIFRNNEGATGGLGAGQQEQDDYGRLVYKIRAAVYLFDLTGSATYRSYVDDHYDELEFILWSGHADPFREEQTAMLLHYTTVAGATTSVVNTIKTTYRSAIEKTNNFQAHDDEVDPYMAYLNAYTWGSNARKAAQGLLFLAVPDYGIDAARNADARQAALRYLHYLHGVNPFGLVYLSNMYDYGAEKGVNEFYHSWFTDGSPQWDRVGTSTYGPAPGFLTGGPNPSYDWDGCCNSSSCGSPQNNALCTATSIVPPKNQPAQKAYKDFNSSWPLNSWAVTENSNGYQLAYIRLLSAFTN